MSREVDSGMCFMGVMVYIDDRILDTTIRTVRLLPFDICRCVRTANLTIVQVANSNGSKRANRKVEGLAKIIPSAVIFRWNTEGTRSTAVGVCLGMVV